MLRRVVPERFLNTDEANRRFHPSFVARFARGLNETDARGDAIVAACAAMPGRDGMRAVDAWLGGAKGPSGANAPSGRAGGEVPDAIAELMEPIAELPDWVDFDRIDRGGVALWRGGPWAGLALNCAALAAGYRSAAAVKPLV